ncbi:ABC transporter substrate-binding protein [Clostridium oceanicum]|uniref:Peptide ABC transporter substrate-binding protein n=1 Tax=Clostridium oceanicum TaxID=1543 RepID=A0ABN1J9N8_9CLOT
MKKITYILIVFVFIVFFICGCVEKNVKVESKNVKRNYMVYDIDSEPKDLIMLGNSNKKEQNILISLFDGLVSLDKNNKIKGELSKKWEINKDKTKYKFILKDNIYWSNGDKITAKDFEKFFINIIEYSKENNIKIDDLKCIYGVSQYMNIGDRDKIAIKAKEDNSLEISLNYPCDYFLDILAKPCYKLRKIDKKLLDYKNTCNKIPYSGAFVIDTVAKEGMNLKKNKYYWDKDKIKNEKIKVNFNKSNEESLAGFKMGKVDVFMDPPDFELDVLKDNGLITSKNIQKLKILSINNKNFKDTDLRKSIDCSIDREYICTHIYNGLCEKADSYVIKKEGSKANPYYKKYFEFNKNHSKAKELLKKSIEKAKKEKKDYKGEFVLHLISKDTSKDKNICEYISKSIKDALNINVVWKSYESQKDLNKAIKNGEYDVALTECNGEYSNSLEFLNILTNISYKNNYGYNNYNYDTFIRNAKIQKDSKKKKDLILKAQDVLEKDSSILPLGFKKSILCKSSKLDGIYMDKLGNVVLKYYNFLDFN